MQTLTIHGHKYDSTILVGEKFQNVSKYLPPSRTVVITDNNVWHHYQGEIPDVEVIRIETGEEIKTLETVENIYKMLLELQADRSTFILGIGGGVVCDITGFVASTFLRGLRFGFVSTSLLSQVDASVGGKNGVNLAGFKNMIGIFNQPEFVICDMSLLKTLADKEISCGMAEIAKHAVIADINLISFLEQNFAKSLDLDAEVIEKLVYDSVVIKAGVVNADEREQGERRKLNFGHTFGHAIEKLSDFTHGESVAAGMVIASAISVKKGLLTEAEHQRLFDLLVKLQLPVTTEIDNRKLLAAIRMDKKREGDKIHFVLLEGVGNAVVRDMSFEELALLV